MTTYANVSYSTPPEREKVDPNVIVIFITSVYCAAHGIGDTNCDSRQKMKRDLKAWTKACKEMYIYEYDPVPFNAELPWPMYGTHVRAMSVYNKLGILGFAFEGHNSWATLFPNFYVLARMTRDPEDVHFYGNTAWPYESMWLGTLRTYHEEVGNVDLQLISSRDGRHWERAGGRRPFIPSGPPGSYDEGYTTEFTNPPIPVGDELWFFYASTTTAGRTARIRESHQAAKFV